MFSTLNLSPLKAVAFAAGVALAPISASAQDATVSIAEAGDAVTFINVMTPNEGVTIQELAQQLTLAMETEISSFDGFRNASVHISRDETVVTNYAQWDSEASVQAVVEALTAGDLPELGKAFTISSPVFHPYDVFSITLAAE
ncbi:antibiotic biosynthesis monooxygenase [uncultured Tateyamaria sp.]|uniref:antibiotic biosynthesis monooxygenase n=1 Tax=uncultured Tateyamaria sp. TaxID=455651 RepID=UPI00262347CB|nr:antibiotic biosynthesis monooxygenase [uncultured Tateyamaria sp.]